MMTTLQNYHRRIFLNMKEIDQKLMRNEYFLEKGFDKILKIFAMLLPLVVIIVDRTMLLLCFFG